MSSDLSYFSTTSDIRHFIQYLTYVLQQTTYCVYTTLAICRKDNYVRYNTHDISVTSILYVVYKFNIIYFYHIFIFRFRFFIVILNGYYYNFSINYYSFNIHIRFTFNKYILQYIYISIT